MRATRIAPTKARIGAVLSVAFAPTMAAVPTMHVPPTSAAASPLESRASTRRTVLPAPDGPCAGQRRAGRALQPLVSAQRPGVDPIPTHRRSRCAGQGNPTGEESGLPQGGATRGFLAVLSTRRGRA